MFKTSFKMIRSAVLLTTLVFFCQSTPVGAFVSTSAQPLSISQIGSTYITSNSIKVGTDSYVNDGIEDLGNISTPGINKLFVTSEFDGVKYPASLICVDFMAVQESASGSGNYGNSGSGSFGGNSGSGSFGGFVAGNNYSIWVPLQDNKDCSTWSSNENYSYITFNQDESVQLNFKTRAQTADEILLCVSMDPLDYPRYTTLSFPATPATGICYSLNELDNQALAINTTTSSFAYNSDSFQYFGADRYTFDYKCDFYSCDFSAIPNTMPFVYNLAQSSTGGTTINLNPTKETVSAGQISAAPTTLTQIIKKTDDNITVIAKTDEVKNIAIATPKSYMAFKAESASKNQALRIFGKVQVSRKSAKVTLSEVIQLDKTLQNVKCELVNLKTGKILMATELNLAGKCETNYRSVKNPKSKLISAAFRITDSTRNHIYETASFKI